MALPILVFKGTQVASSTISIDKITPRTKRHKTGGKGKEKADTSVWNKVEVALTRSHNVVITDDLRELSGVPFHKVVNRHIHKLV